MNHQTIFDLIQDEPSSDVEAFLDLAEKAPQPKDKSFLNDVSDYAKTFLKGGIEGISRLGRIMGPLDTGKSSEKQFEEQTQSLDELLPTDEGFTQKAIRRGLKQAPSIAGFPGSTLATLPRSVAAGFLGEGAKELGAPEWAQSALELTAFIGPDITKKLLSSGKNKEIIDFAKSLGMTDEQITPLLQSNFKQKWLTKLSPKRGGTEKALADTKEALSRSYETLQQSPTAKVILPRSSQDKLIDALNEKLLKMPASVRNKVKEDLSDLMNAPITGESLINFYTDVNHYLSDNAKQLSLLKEPIKEALKAISPELTKDFEMLNGLFTRYFPIAGRLKPTLSSDIISAVETLGALGSTLGIFFGHYPSMLAIFSEQAVRKLAQQMLINPRFQQLSRKMVVALNQNKYGLAQKVTQDLKKEISKFSPESADKIQEFSKEDFEELLKQHQR